MKHVKHKGTEIIKTEDLRYPKNVIDNARDIKKYAEKYLSKTDVGRNGNPKIVL